MATLSPLDNRKPEESDNPGQEDIDKKVSRSQRNQDFLKQRENLDNPDPKDNQRMMNRADPRGDKLDLGPEKSLYRETAEEKSRFQSLLSRGNITKKKAFAAGALLLATIAVSATIFIALLPFKILHVVNNLQDHFFSTAENATQRETDKLLSEYVKKYFLPALRDCPGSVTRDCNPIPTTSNPVSRLFKGWRNAKLEDKIAKNYGIEFKYSAGNYYMKAPGLAKEVNIDGFAYDKSGMTLDEYVSKSSDFKGMSRSEIRQAVKDATANETRWKRVMYRYKIGRLLEEKYGIKRCIIFCGTRDALADNKQAQKTAAKLYLVERVIQPRDASLAVVLTCFFDAGCNPTAENEPSSTAASPCEPNVDCELNGAPENKETDKAIRISLEELATQLGIKDSAALLADYATLEKYGMQTFVIKYVMKNVFNQEITDATAKELSTKINFITWVNMASRLVSAADGAPMKLKKLSYLTNAAAVVSLFSMYRTYADEIKTGKVNATEVGSMVDSLGPIAKDANLADLKGGTAEAEETPLYDSLINGGTGAGSSDYKCDSGQSASGGSGAKLTCPEEKLAVDSSFLDSLKNIVDAKIPECGCSLAQIAKAWNGTIGHLIGMFGSLVGWVLSPFMGVAQSIADKACLIKIPFGGGYPPGPFQTYCEVRDLISAATTGIINFATSQLFPSPFSENMSGGRTFDLMAAGADVSGNDFAHNGLGGQALTSVQTAYIRSSQAQSELQSYKNQSFFARILDTDSSYSPVTKLAMAMPGSTSALQSDLASIFTKPMSMFANLGSILRPPDAMAAATQDDPFGVTQYGYPENDPQVSDFFHQDHETYWDKYCDPSSPDYITDQWNTDGGKIVDSNTGMPMNTTFNGCLLINSTTGSDGAVFDSGLLTTDDLSDTTAPSTGVTTPATQSAGSTIDMGQLLRDSTSVACAAGTRDLGIQDGYTNGQKIEIRICAIPNLPSSGAESNGQYGVAGGNGQAIVNSRVSGAVLAMVQAAANEGVTLRASSSFRTMSHQQCLYDKTCGTNTAAAPGYSNHQMGLAIDFVDSNGLDIRRGDQWFSWLSKNGSSFGYHNDPSIGEDWHWSPTGN